MLDRFLVQKDKLNWIMSKVRDSNLMKKKIDADILIMNGRHTNQKFCIPQ